MKFPISFPGYFPFLILILLLLIPLLAIGRGFRLDLLPDKGKTFGCATCHINPGGGGARNPFGKDWEAIAIPQGDKYVDDIAEKDSDGDGSTNDEEFEAEAHPGDAGSKPPESQAVEPRRKKITRWGKIRSESSN